MKDTPGKPTPVFEPKPKSLTVDTSFSRPTFMAMLMVPTFDDLASTSTAGSDAYESWS